MNPVSTFSGEDHATQITLLHLEAMGTHRLPGTAQTGCDRARSLEHQQVRASPLAAVKDPGARTGTAGAVLQQYRATRSCGAVGMIFIEPPCT